MPEHLAPNLVSWASILDDVTREQAIQTSKMPFVRPHLALMPDAHLGKGSTVGSVLPTVGAIMPAAVGVDIGCGMIATRTQFTRDELTKLADLRVIRERIEKAIPLSVGKQNAALDTHAAASVRDLERRADYYGADPDRHKPEWRLQLGTLGSGNHFIELSVDEEDRVWVFLHSGSRGVGNLRAPRPRVPRRGHARVPGVHRRDAVGAGVRRAQPARHAQSGPRHPHRGDRRASRRR